MKLTDAPRIPEFDPKIIARHITRDFILECMHARYVEGKTDEKVTSDVPNARAGHGESLDREHGEMMRDRIINILDELRHLGMLKQIPNGQERGIPEIKAWNDFVNGGSEAMDKHQLWSLMDCPLPSAISYGAWVAVYETVRDMRKERGLEPHPAMNAADRVGTKALMTIVPDDLETLATAAALGAVSRGSGMTRAIMIGRNSMTCRKTDECIEWKEDALIAPSAGKWHYPARGSGEPARFNALAPLKIAKPIRQIDITLPSGILLAADWFRIPGFTEGVGDDDHSTPSINSDLGIDERTRDHYDRLGLMRIHTTNCVPTLIRDGEAIRIGYFDEDHEDYWTEEGERTGLATPEILGLVCCDLWDVTFADREILIDILMAGAEKIEANGGIGYRGRDVTDHPKSRDEAGRMLDAYAEDAYVQRLEFEPGTVLQVTMATGHGSQNFFENFRSQDLSDIPGMEDMFVLSPEPVSPDPEIAEDVDQPDWSWPERYAPSAEGPTP